MDGGVIRIAIGFLRAQLVKRRRRLLELLLLRLRNVLMMWMVLRLVDDTHGGQFRGRLSQDRLGKGCSRRLHDPVQASVDTAIHAGAALHVAVVVRLREDVVDHLSGGQAIKNGRHSRDVFRLAVIGTFRGVRVVLVSTESRVRVFM